MKTVRGPSSKSHISHVVADSKLEVSIAHVLEEHEGVESFAKNDRLFLEIPYRYLGASSNLLLVPDFIVRKKNDQRPRAHSRGKRPGRMRRTTPKATAARSGGSRL